MRTIGLLVGICIGSIGCSNDGVQSNQPTQSQINLAVAQMKGTLQPAVEAYCLHHGEYPQTLNDLLVRTNGKGPYLQTSSAIVDPWGNPYQMGPPPDGKTVPTIYTIQPDGVKISNYQTSN